MTTAERRHILPILVFILGHAWIGLACAQSFPRSAGPVPQSQTPSIPSIAVAPGACSPARIDVGGYSLWVQVAGAGEPTVVFESGGGNDSAVWVKIESDIRKYGVRTVVYDRAGLGQSDPNPGPYRIEDEATALTNALSLCGIRGPIVLVAHSYGAFVSILLAANDPRVAGVVLVDGTLPDYFDDAQVDRILAEYAPQFDGLKSGNPKLAAVMIPVLLAYPETIRRLRSVKVPLYLPVIDILAEHSFTNTPEEAAANRRAHATFVAAASTRESVFASGSSHNVMQDRPELVIDAIKRMVQRVRPSNASRP